MADLILVVSSIFVILIIADLFSGIAHWAQDRFDTENIPFFNHMIIYKANEHHNYEKQCTEYTWYIRNKSPIIMLFFSLMALILLNSLNWQIFLFLLLFFFSGEFHVWAHRSSRENGLLISSLQKMKIIQSPSHHQKHHRHGNKNYCIITNIVNPALDAFNFFGMLDSAFLRHSSARS